MGSARPRHLTAPMGAEKMSKKMKIRINNTMRDVAPAIAAVIRQQPGYHRQNPARLMLAMTASGGVRLYSVETCGWMDASLADITDLHVIALVESCR